MAGDPLGWFDRRALLGGGSLAMLASSTEPLGAAPSGIAAQATEGRLLDGEAWDDFCDVLKVAGKTIGHFGSDAGPLDRVEWYRFLTRMMRHAIERFVESADRSRLSILNASALTGISINFTDPNETYLISDFDSDGDYRLTGNRGTTPYFVVAAWSAKIPAGFTGHDWAPAGTAGLSQFDTATTPISNFLQSDKMRFEPNGDFEIILSQRAHPGNWVKLEPGSIGTLIRLVHHDRAKERDATFRIERMTPIAEKPLTAPELSAGLAKAAQFVLGYAELVRSWWQDNLAKRPNQLRFSRTTYLSNGGVADRHFAFGVWQKPKGQALVIEFMPPEPTEAWIFQLCNMWQENLDDYPQGRGYVDKFRARREADGRVRIVIADTDPGVGGNWIDPLGHVQGGMGLRIIKTDAPPAVTSWLLPLTTLRKQGWKALSPANAVRSGELVP